MKYQWAGHLRRNGSSAVVDEFEETESRRRCAVVFQFSWLQIFIVFFSI